MRPLCSKLSCCIWTPMRWGPCTIAWCKIPFFLGSSPEILAFASSAQVPALSLGYLSLDMSFTILLSVSTMLTNKTNILTYLSGKSCLFFQGFLQIPFSEKPTWLQRDSFLPVSICSTCGEFPIHLPHLVPSPLRASLLYHRMWNVLSIQLLLSGWMSEFRLTFPFV